MALNTHALRFVANRKMRVSLGSKARETCSIRGIDQFTFDAHIKVGAGATSLSQKAYVETHGTRTNLRFACTPTRDNGRSVLVFEFARASNSSPTSYRYELPNGWDDRWHHVAFSVSTGDGKYAIFFDDLKVKEGRLVGGGFDQYNRALLIDDAIPKEISIGAAPTGSSSNYVYWDGKIDNVRLFRKFVNGNTYSSADSPIDDHCNKVGSFAVDINLIEEWRFNEGPLGSSIGTTFGVVDHQYDPELKSVEYANADNQNNNSQQGEEDFDPGPPVIADATLYEDTSKTSNLWIGVDVADDITNSSGVVLLARDSDRPFLGEGLLDTQPPSVPTNLVTGAVTEDSFEVSWRASLDNVFVQDYEVVVSTQDSFATAIVTKRVGRRTTDLISGLVPAQRYYWRVRALDAANNESAWASSSAYVPFTLKPTSKVNYSPNPSFEGTRHLHAWEPHAVNGTIPNLSIQAYTVTDTRPDLGNTVYGDNYLVVQSNAGVSGLFRGAAHTLAWVPNREMKVSFWVKGSAEFGVYAYLMQDNKTLAATPLLSLTDATTNQSATTQILTSSWKKFSFTINSSNAKLNQVKLLFVSTTSAEFNFGIDGILIETGSNTGTYFDGSHKGTLPLTAYWAVFETTSATNRDGYIVGPQVDDTLYFTDESASIYDVETYPIVPIQTFDFADRTAPNSPTVADVSHAAADDIGSSSFIAKWKAPVSNYEDIIAYELQVGLKSNLSARDPFFLPGYELLRIYDAALVNGVYTRVVTGLSPTTTYYYRVRSLDSNNNFSAWSDSKPITTEAIVDTLPPSEVILDEPTEVSFDGFTLNWREAFDDIGVVGYRVTVALDANFQQVVSGLNSLNVGNVLSYEVVGLQEQTQYYCRVRAYDTVGLESPLPDEGLLIETLIRPPELGGYISQRLALESLLNVSASQTTTSFGELSTIRLDKNKQALFQFTLNRTIARGDIKSAMLNLTRLDARQTDMNYKIYALSPQGSDVLASFYVPATATFATKPNDVSGSLFEVPIDQPRPEIISTVSLDITDIVQKGAVYYGFRLQAEPLLKVEAEASSSMFAVGNVRNNAQSVAPASVMLATSSIKTNLNNPDAINPLNGNLPFYTIDDFYSDFGGTQNSNESYRPSVSFMVDTSTEKLISVSKARVSSSPHVVRNLFPNPTFDTTAEQFPIPNSSFELNDTRYWDASSNNVTFTFTRSNLSYDATGGSGNLNIITNSSEENSLSATVVNEYKIPVIEGVTYTTRAFVSTSNPNLKPRIAILRYAEDGSLLGTEVELTAWSPTANIWYQRQHQYTVPSGSTTKYLKFAVVVQSLVAQSVGDIRIDTVSVTSTAVQTPLFVESIQTATVERDSNKSFDSGFESTGASLKVTSSSTSGSGTALVAEIPLGESWLTDSFGNETINLVANPSFENLSLDHVTTVGANTTKTSSFVSGARAGRALKVTSSNATHGVVIKSVTIPRYKTVAAEKFFTGSCWVLGGYTYKAKLTIVYNDDSVETGTERLFTVAAGQWQRLTLAEGLPISVTGNTTNANSSPIKHIELSLTVELGSAPATPVTWYVDAVQIEERSSLTAAPSTYCDGDQDECHWYGVAHNSISFRHAFVAGFKLQVNNNVTELASRLVVTTAAGSTGFESPQTIIGTIPQNATTGWIAVRTWPVITFGASSAVPPLEAKLEVYTTSATSRVFTIDAASITFNDDAKTYFNGATLKGLWRQEDFASISESSGSQITSRVHTRGNVYESGSIQTYFKADKYADMEFQQDDSVISRYERDARYVDVIIPDRIRWNEVYNPSFELGVLNWKAENSSITNKLSPTAAAGGSVGVWSIGQSPSAATVFTDDLVPVQAGQQWSAKAKVRAPLIVRSTTVRGLFGFTFYNASGAEISASTYVSEFDIFDKTSWKIIENSAVVPDGAVWVRLVFKNVAVGNSFGFLSSEQLEIDEVMLYQGPSGRHYFDGDNNDSVLWEGRRHRSPSIFVFNGGEKYSLRFLADDGDGISLGLPVETTIQIEDQGGDFIEFLFDQHERNVTSRSIELAIPYRGGLQDQVTITGVYRRVDSFERTPVTVEIDKFRNTAYVRAEDLAQNREYVFELEVVAEDRSKVYGEFQYTTRVSSSVQQAQSASKDGDGLIQFNAFTLNGPGSEYYWVSEHDAFSLPDRRTQIETIPRMDGGIELKPYWGTKKISISGGVWGTSRAHLYDNVNALRSALTEQRGKLRIDTLANNEDYYYATCTDFSTKEVAGESIHSLQWDASFECADPFFYRGEPKVSTFEIRSSKPENTIDVYYTEDQRFTVYNAGTVNAVPTITLGVTKGSGDYSVAFVNETTGQRIMPKAVLSRNDKITLDTRPQTVTKNQAIGLDYVGSFIELKPGPNIIRASIRDLLASRHNLLLNAGVERGPAVFSNTDDEGIRPSYKLTSQGGKTPVTGVTVSRNRFQTATSSDYAALVECDGLQKGQGVVFSTNKRLAETRFSASPDQRRTFSASAYVRSDVTTREVALTNCFIRIWYTDGTTEDLASAATSVYRLNTQWRLIQLPQLTSSSKSINYVEVHFLFKDEVLSNVSFYIDNVLLTQSNLSAEQVESAFELVITHQERFI